MVCHPQIEYHPFLSSHPTLKALLAYHAEHKIITASYGGLTPIIPHHSGPSSLETSREALKVVLNNAREKRGPEVTQNQILLKWLQQKGFLAVTSVCPSQSFSCFTIDRNHPLYFTHIVHRRKNLVSKNIWP